MMRRNTNQRKVENRNMLLLSTFCVLLLAACGPRGTSFRIEGTLRDMQVSELYMYNLSAATARFDTLQLRDGNFRYAGTAESPTPYILVFPNGVEHVIFADGGQVVRYEAVANDLKNYVAEGGEENKRMTRFREEAAQADEGQTQALAAQYIREAPQSPVAIYLFDRYFVQNRPGPDAQFGQLLALLRQQHPENLYLLDIEGSLKSTDKGTVGSKLPRLSLKAKGDKTLELAPATGSKQATLLTFWATWMPQQWKFTDKMRDIAHDDAYRTKLRIVAISLDTEIYRWESGTRTDTVGIAHCCDGLAWNSPAAMQLGVRSVPLYILADTDGTIVARGNDPDQMLKDVKKHTAP